MRVLEPRLDGEDPGEQPGAAHQHERVDERRPVPAGLAGAGQPQQRDGQDDEPGQVEHVVDEREHVLGGCRRGQPERDVGRAEEDEADQEQQPGGRPGRPVGPAARDTGGPAPGPGQTEDEGLQAGHREVGDGERGQPQAVPHQCHASHHALAPQPRPLSG